MFAGEEPLCGNTVNKSLLLLLLDCKLRETLSPLQTSVQPVERDISQSAFLFYGTEPKKL